MAFSFLFGWASEFYTGLASIIGAYIAGIFVSRSGIKEKIEKNLNPLVNSISSVCWHDIKGRGSAYYSNNRRFVEGNITEQY